MKICLSCDKNLWRGNKTGYCVKCLGVVRSGTNNQFFGKTHSTETKSKMSRPRSSMLGDKNPRYGKKHTDETKAKISKLAKERLKNRPELLEQLRLNGVKSSLSSYRITKPQRIVQEWLNGRNIRYKINGLVDRYSYDFILLDHKIIIEVHGTYWHADPRMYGEDKIKLTERQEFKVKQDIIKKNVVESYGYTIFYIWEMDIKNKHFSSIEPICKII